MEAIYAARAKAVSLAHPGVFLDAPNFPYLREHAKQELDPAKYDEKYIR